MNIHIHIGAGSSNIKKTRDAHENPVMQKEIKGRGPEFVQEMEAAQATSLQKHKDLDSQMRQKSAELRKWWDEETARITEALMDKRAALRRKYPMKDGAKDVSWKPSKFAEGVRVRAKANIPTGSSYVEPGRIGISSGVIVRGGVQVDFNGMTKYIEERFLEPA